MEAIKALVKYAPGPGKVELREVAEPSPGSNQVKIQVKAAGICGSDLHIYHGDIKLALEPPVIMGHEFSGVIAEVGEGVSDLEVGARVTSETAMYTCGRCPMCRTGRYNICPEKKLLGYVFDGCFAPYCVVNRELVHPLPDNVDFVAGALSEPLACCVHAVMELTHVVAGDTVLVTGPGAIGLISMQLAKACGGYVVVCGLPQDEDRQSIASELGADLILIVGQDDLEKTIFELTDGQGADVFLECSGAPPAARLGLSLTRRGGQYTQIGLFGRPFELDFETIAYKELRVTGSLGQRWTAWRRGLTLMSRGQVLTKPLVTHILPLDRWQEGFRLFEEKKALKVILEPGN